MSGSLPDPHADTARVARLALAEDGAADITSDVTIARGLRGTGAIEFRSGGVLAGTAYANAVVEAVGLGHIAWRAGDGDRVDAGATVGTYGGALPQVLRAERTLLNLMQRACGIATATRAYVDAVAGTRCRILHTRKTAPGLRGLDVGAVVAGGGLVHRLDLATAVMVKDNHWRTLERSGRTLRQALDAARARGVTALYVEVESLPQIAAACEAGASRLLVDNQAPGTFREWAALARARRPGIEVEATGGITLQNVRAYAEAGADYASIGALTHSVRAGDLAVEVTVD